MVLEVSTDIDDLHDVPHNQRVNLEVLDCELGHKLLPGQNHVYVRYHKLFKPLVRSWVRLILRT